MKKNHRTLTEKKHSVDGLMRNVALTLIRDFQDTLTDPCFADGFRDAVRSGSVARIRESVPAVIDNGDVYLFKATYQLQSLVKRYRFRKDIYSDDELTQKAISTFRETQDRLAALDLDSLSRNSQTILDLAASYVAKVLGTYSDEEHRSLCRFGRKASVGIPARLACEAARWELPISGSREQISWFDSEMSQDWMVQEYWARQKGSDLNRSTYQETDSLKLTLVPKTFKSLRSIMPNTTIGSYMSYGLGEMIRKRLRREGYDIKSLQMRHRYLAREASVHGLHVTADLSSASDSISVALVHRLFPPDWYEILRQSRIGKVDLPDGSSVESLTHCTMGVGYTFPLQTLVFLSLLKAIQAFYFGAKDRRTISVYGDDLVYSNRMHYMVVRHFEEFGFVINLDKTYHEGHFRESCGGDYYRGVDVRPFQPRNGSASVGDRAYEAILYKYINGLLMRWSEYEIGRTLSYLTSEVEALVGKVKVVPQDFPDDAGVKCPSLSAWDFLRRSKVCKPKSLGHGLYRFPYLRLVSDERKEVRHDPYYWIALRGTCVSGHQFIDDFDFASSRGLPSPVQARIELLTGAKEDVRLLLTREDRPVQMIRCHSGHRLRRTSTYVTVSHTGRYTRQSGVSGFETRR